MIRLGLKTVARIARQPIDEARLYTPGKAWRDAVAGLTVAVVAVPQSMAYAEIAGVGLQYGLYTVIIQCLIGSLFNSQRFLSVGPINTQSLLVFATASVLFEPRSEQFLSIVIALTFLKGLIQMGLAGLQLGALVRYVSQAVIVGFTAGAGVLIALKQVKNFISVNPVSPESPAAAWPGVVGIFKGLLPVVDNVHPPSVVVGCVALGAVIGSRWVHRLMPGPLLAVGLGGALVWAAGWQPLDETGRGDLLLVGELPRALPGFAIPVLDWSQMQALLGGAFALALLGLMEAYSIGKMIASKTGQRISANQELLSQGFTNFTSSFFQCIPGSGSFSRSALNYYAGARTLYAGVFNSLFVAVIFLTLAPLARYVPMASLAAVLFVIAYGLVDWRAFRRMIHTSRADTIVCAGTFVATLFAPLQYAVFLGVILNLALYLRRASRLHISQIQQSGAGRMVEQPVESELVGDDELHDVVFLSLEGDLFFAVADELQDRLSETANGGARVAILRLKRTHMIDATVLGVLEMFAQTMKERGKHVILCGLKPELMERIEGYGLDEVIGKENIFATREGVFASAKAALERARQLLGYSIDAEPMLADAQLEESQVEPVALDRADQYEI